MCIKDKKWLKRFCLALLGLCLYLFDTGSDTAVGNTLIQNCHVRFGAAVLCLVYVLPGLFLWLKLIIDPQNQDGSCCDFCDLFFCVFIVPVTAFELVANLVKMNDEWLNRAKG